MSVAVNKLISRQEGEKGSCPVAASTHLYQGTLAFFNASGYLVDIVASGANPFAGVMIGEADNSSGSNGDINGSFWTEGDFPMTGTGFTQATVGLDVYASDNYTVTTSNSSTSYVGRCTGYVSSTVIIVTIKKTGPTLPLAANGTGTTGTSFTVATSGGKPRASLGYQSGGTGDYKATVAPPTTLTADRVFTLIGDADASLVGVATTQTLTNKTLTSPTLTTPTIGVATGTSLAVTGLLTSSSPSAGIGYATGAGSTVSQATDRTTGVTINAVSGAITTQATSLAAGASVQFTVTNSAVAVGDTVVCSVRSGPTTTSTSAQVVTVANGSFKIMLVNSHASTADTGAAIINFAVIKAVSA